MYVYYLDSECEVHQKYVRICAYLYFTTTWLRAMG